MVIPTDPSNPTLLDPTLHPPVTAAKDIPNAFRAYYEPLFGKKTPVPEAVAAAREALSKGNKALPPTAEACGAPIRDSEVLSVCKNLPTGKSPGPDRLPNAFYKNFADLMAPVLTAAYNQAFQNGQLPASMLEGIISVLYKKKDRADPRNYRPITLLNGDYKILIRVLTRRLNTVSYRL